MSKNLLQRYSLFTILLFSLGSHPALAAEHRQAVHAHGNSRGIGHVHGNGLGIGHVHGKSKGNLVSGSEGSEYCYAIPAGAPVTCRGLNDSGQSLGAADVVASLGHATPYNDERDWALVGTSALELTWQALQRDASKPGSFSPFPASPTPDGSILYWTPGANSGYPNVYAVNANTGEIVWKTMPWIKDPVCDYEDMAIDPLTCNNPTDTPDPWTYFGATTVDDQGNAYVADLDQLWAFSPEAPTGEYKTPLWVVDIAQACGGRPWIGNAVIYRRDALSPRFLAAACAGGSFILVNIEAGIADEDRVVDSLPIPALAPPAPCPPIIGDLYWAHGEETFLRTVRETGCAATGVGLPFTETQALDPATAIIYQAGVSNEPNIDGKLYAVRIVQDTDGSWGLEQLWTEPGRGAMGANGSTSPTIQYLTDLDVTADPSAAVVYASDESGIMYAFDAASGVEIARSVPGLTVGFSPQIAFNGYLTNANSTDLVALQLNLTTGTLDFVPGWGGQDWSFLLGPGFGDLSQGPDVVGLPPDITINPLPQVTIQGGIPQYANSMSAPATLVYEGTYQNATFYSVFKQSIVNVNPDTGLYVPNSFYFAYPQKGSWMGGLNYARWGGRYDSFRAEGRSKPWLNTINPELVNSMPAGGDFYVQEFEPEGAPGTPGGIQGTVPISPLGHAKEVIDFMANTMVDETIAHINEGRFQLAFDIVRRLPPNITRQAAALVGMAEAKGEISQEVNLAVQEDLRIANLQAECARGRTIDSNPDLACLASTEYYLNLALGRFPL